MTLTPTTIRLDFIARRTRLNCGPNSKPCGNACIPKDRKCRASWNKPVKLAAGTAAVLGAGLVGTALFHPRTGMRSAAHGLIDPVVQAGHGLGNIARGRYSAAAVNAANIASSGRNFGRNARTVAEGYGTDIGNAYNAGKTVVFKWRHHRPAARGDAMSSGLTPQSIRIDLKCGRGAISPGEKCHKGKASSVTLYVTNTRFTGVSRRLQSGTTEQLAYHRQMLNDILVERYGKPINNMRQYSDYRRWASRQPEQKEADAVTAIINSRIRKTKRSDATARRCGKGYVAAGKKCRKGGAIPSRKAIAIGLGAAALTAGGIYLATRGRRAPSTGLGASPPTLGFRNRKALTGAPTPRVLPGDRTTRRLTGFTPKGLLPPRPPKSKTQRLRENTQAAIRGAERDIGRATQAEITRLGAVGNAMASAGEATGMATKTTLRELRLRAEALRRRYEPGYRRASRPAPQAPPQLPEGGAQAFRAPFAPGASPSPDVVRPPRRQRRRPDPRRDFYMTRSPWVTDSGLQNVNLR